MSTDQEGDALDSVTDFSRTCVLRKLVIIECYYLEIN